MCIFNERVILQDIIKTFDFQQAVLPVYSGHSVVPQEADRLHPDVDCTQILMKLSCWSNLTSRLKMKR